MNIRRYDLLVKISEMIDMLSLKKQKQTCTHHDLNNVRVIYRLLELAIPI